MLVTEAEARRIDVEWARLRWRERWLAELGALGISQDDFDEARHEHHKETGYHAMDSDLAWTLLDRASLQYAQAGDFHGLKMVCYSQALFVDEEGRNSRDLLALAAEMELMDLRRTGIERVRIQSADREKACDACLQMHGEILTVEAALCQMPLPVNGCTRRLGADAGFCRCRYVAVTERTD